LKFREKRKEKREKRKEKREKRKEKRDDEFNYNLKD
jgi:hypothetical protein